jgi:outer membrane protein assembly factor BamB
MRPAPGLVIALVLSCLPFAGNLHAEEWPGWRGPRGNGITSDSAPIKWSATENIAWRTKIPGAGL